MRNPIWPRPCGLGACDLGKRPDLSIGKVNKFLIDFLCNIPILIFSRNRDTIGLRDEERG